MDKKFEPDSAAVLRRLADQAPAMLGYWDRELRCRFANRAYQDWFGIEAGALLGSSLQELLGPDLFALNRPHVEAALRGEVQIFERSIGTQGGMVRHSLAQYTPDTIDGRVLGFFVQVTDISQVKLTEAALRESEQRYRALSELSPLGIFRARASGSITYSNLRWRQICGLGEEHGLGEGWKHTVHKDDQGAVFAALEDAVSKGREFELAFRLVHPDSAVRAVRCRARPAPTSLAAAGVIDEYVGTLEDVTDLRRTDERLRASEAFLERTGRVARVGGWEVDLRTQECTWSERTRLIHEVDADYRPTVAGAIEFYAPEARPVIAAALERAIATGAPWDLELRFATARGRAIWVRAYGEVEYENGEAVRLIGAFQDITEQRQRRDELEQEQALRADSERHASELDRLLNERSEMLDVLAHEVRQPLNNASASLQSAATTLAEFGEGVASRRLHRAQAVMGQVLASIDNTLAVAALLVRPEPIRREDTDIDTLLAIAIADMPVGERQRIRIDRVSGARSAAVDMGLMRLALRNLLSNALKFSGEDAAVVIRLSENEETQALLLDVVDRGTGIAAEVLPRLFQRGVRARGSDATAQRSQGGGMGLGLYIVRRVMELHGGHAELAANTPQGVTMRLVIDETNED